MQFPVHIELHRSRLLVASLLLLHTLAIICVVVLPWPWQLRSLVCAVLCWSVGYALRPSKIVSLHLSGQGRLDCRFADGERATALLLPGSSVFHRLIVLRMQIGDTRRTVNLVLLPDSIAKGQFRALRLWLRWRTNENVVKSA